jgi:hypothetical protein
MMPAKPPSPSTSFSVCLTIDTIRAPTSSVEDSSRVIDSRDCTVSSVRLRSVTSRSTPAKRTMSPDSSRIGKERSQIQRTEPSGLTMRNSLSQWGLDPSGFQSRSALRTRSRSSGWTSSIQPRGRLWICCRLIPQILSNAGLM